MVDEIKYSSIKGKLKEVKIPSLQEKIKYVENHKQSLKLNQIKFITVLIFYRIIL